MATLHDIAPMSIRALIPKGELKRHLRLGKYQIAALRGDYAWSGADLRGKAAKYASHYARARHNALEKVRAAVMPFGVDLVVIRGKHGKLSLQWTVAGMPLQTWNAAKQRPGLAGMVEW